MYDIYKVDNTYLIIKNLIYKVDNTYLIIKMIKYFIFTDHINVLVSSIINLYFNPKAHCTGTGP